MIPNGDVLLNGGAVVLPNRTRTPGATNPAVTQATIGNTICRAGYTTTIRPSSDYTTPLKERQLASGYAFRGDTDPSDYEEDHLTLRPSASTAVRSADSVAPTLG